MVVNEPEFVIVEKEQVQINFETISVEKEEPKTILFELEEEKTTQLNSTAPPLPLRCIHTRSKFLITN